MKATIEKLNDTQSIATGMVFDRRRAFLETEEGRIPVLPVFVFRPNDGRPYAVDLKRIRTRDRLKTRFFLASPRPEQFLSKEELLESVQLVRYVTWHKGNKEGSLVCFDTETGMAIVPNWRAWKRDKGSDPKEGETALVFLELNFTYLVATPIKEEGVGGGLMVIASEAENLRSEFERRHVLSPEGKWLNVFSDVLGIDEAAFTLDDVRSAYRREASKHHTDKLPKHLKEEVRKVLEESAGKKVAMLKDAKARAEAFYHTNHEGKCGWRKQDGHLCENKHNGRDFCKMHADKRDAGVVEATETEG